jgi:D-serine deaminase-like pyridoxal phosphate-dependent protein
MDLDTPVLWTDLDALERNIGDLARFFMQAGVSWRPHIKGIKVPAIAHQMLAAGAIGVTCAKLGEAEVMAEAGIQDLLIANQIVGSQKISRLVHLCQQADVKVAVDDPVNVAELGRSAANLGVELGVIIEVDIGMSRAGVAPGQPTVDLAQIVNDTKGLRFAGVMGWEGQTRHILDRHARRPAIEQAVGLLLDTAQLCREAGLSVSIVSAGGTGTYHVTAFQSGVTEIQAGGAIFGDVASKSWGVETEPALFVHTTITSRPSPDRVIIDAGFKALPGWKYPPHSAGLSGVKHLGFSAEHGTLTLKEPNLDLRVGDSLDFLVGYGDVTICLYDELYGLRAGLLEVIWPVVARGKLR